LSLSIHDSVGTLHFFLYTNNERVWNVGTTEKKCGRKNCPFDSQEHDTHITDHPVIDKELLMFYKYRR